MAALPQKPAFSADPLNLFVVVESGDHHVTILDGDRFEPIHRFPEPLRAARRPEILARRPLSSSSVARRLDHQVRPVDLDAFAEVRAGINCATSRSRATAAASPAANYLPHSLVILSMPPTCSC